MSPPPSVDPPAEAPALHRAIRAVLVSAPMMWVKRTIRDAAWTVRGRALRNPPWPSAVESMLFVCYGNICRSPFAAHLAGQMLREAGIDRVRTISAGFRTSQRATSPPEAIGAAAAFGIDLEGHRPTLLTPELVRASDVVFVMEPLQLDTLRRRWPIERHRFFLLPLFEPDDHALGAYERCHLVDPFGKGAAEFDRCYARIARALTPIVHEWTPRGRV